jgi:hypothetical protein
MKTWKYIYLASTRVERFEFVLEHFRRKLARQAMRVRMVTIPALLLLAFLLLVAAGLGPYMPQLLTDIYIVAMLADIYLLARIAVEQIPVGWSLLLLFVASLVLLAFALGASALGSGAPVGVVIAAGYGAALSMSISFYALARMARVVRLIA